jgi:CopA family copper-resistance protein
VLAGLGAHTVWAEGSVRQPWSVLRGTDFDLQIGETRVNITGREATALTVNGSLPAPTLHWREGDVVTLRVTNTSSRDDASIHWHGIILPANMDGVPGLSFDGIGPRETYTYRFRVGQGGTYWYHSHSAFQEQKGLYGPLLIQPREAEPFAWDREHVVMLSDWTDESGERVFSNLKKRSDYYNFHQRTVGDFVRDVREKGLTATASERAMWGQMRMKPTDLADVSGATYTYLVNGQPPDANWIGTFVPGERVRLRVINGSSMTYFDVRIPGLKLTVVAVDGQYVHPVTVDEFRIAVAETVDVIAEPNGHDAYTLFAQSADRTGFARGTLSVRPHVTAEVPSLDPRPLLTMADMGHGGGHTGHDMGAQPGAATADPHAGHSNAKPADPHARHSASGEAPAGQPQQDMAGMAGMEHEAAPMQMHPPSERGNPLVDMQVMSPSARLDDPGVGLRANGRRVLTYADLHSAFDDPDGREPGRTLELHLTGHMERFAWSFDGIKFSSAEPLRFTYGERLRVVLVNDTMMSHPIHLHGMWSDLEDESGRFMVRKHTVDMPPGTRRSYRVRADALGRWAYHCHLLYHMEAGMFREVRVDE